MWNDGGGKVTAARRPLHGRDHVARWLLGAMAKPKAPPERGSDCVDQRRAGPARPGRRRPSVPFTYGVVDGLLADIRFQVNPDKLAGLRRGRRRGSGDWSRSGAVR